MKAGCMLCQSSAPLQLTLTDATTIHSSGRYALGLHFMSMRRVMACRHLLSGIDARSLDLLAWAPVLLPSRPVSLCNSAVTLDQSLHTMEPQGDTRPCGGDGNGGRCERRLVARGTMPCLKACRL